MTFFLKAEMFKKTPGLKEGTQEFVINDQIAHDLAHMLCTFLLGGQCDTEPFGVAPVVS